MFEGVILYLVGAAFFFWTASKDYDLRAEIQLENMRRNKMEVGEESLNFAEMAMNSGLANVFRILAFGAISIGPGFSVTWVHQYNFPAPSLLIGIFEFISYISLILGMFFLIKLITFTVSYFLKRDKYVLFKI